MPAKLAAMNCSHRFFDLEEFFASSAAAGFGGVELWTGPMHFFMDAHGNDPLDGVRALEQRHGLPVVAVCPEQTNPKPHNVAVRDEAGRARTLAYFCRALDVARGLGAGVVVVTPGWGYLNEPVEAAWERSVSMLRRIAEHAERVGVPLAIEALQRDESNLAHTAAELRDLVDAVDRPALGVCLDTGAMAAAGDTIEGYFATFGELVVHAHFVDVAGATTHLAWGDGERDMAADLASFSSCGYEGWLSSETVDERRFADPAAADAQTMAAFRAAQRALRGEV